MKLKIEYLHEGMKPITRKHCYDAGADVPIYKTTTVKHGKNMIPLGFKLVIPPGYAGFLCLRSSVMGDGVTCNMVPFDTDFAGEWNLIIYNPGEDFVLEKDTRFCQIVILPILDCEFVEELPVRRGENGVGSTGVK